MVPYDNVYYGHFSHSVYLFLSYPVVFYIYMGWFSYHVLYTWDGFPILYIVVFYTWDGFPILYIVVFILVPNGTNFLRHIIFFSS